MEKILHNAKRKKRKTRKCLDELRRRARIVSIKNDVPYQKTCNKPIQNFKNSNCKRDNNNCITSKRLTLTMFAKAIRSETITRPLNYDEKQDRNLVINTKSPPTSPLNIVVESRSSDASGNIGNTNKTDIGKLSDSDNYLNHDDNSFDNFVWFSPSRQVERHRFPGTENEDTISMATSTSRTNEDLGYNLYEELLDDIPTFARRNLSNFIKYDVMRKTKTCLQNLYMENFHQNQENVQVNIVPSILHTSISTSDISQTTPKENIVQNPMDYIRIGWRRGGLRHSYDSTPSDPGMSPLRSPPPCSPVTTQISIISYTPDYNFYPHRLNE